VNNQKIIEDYEDKRFNLLVDYLEQNILISDPRTNSVEYKINQLTLKENEVDALKTKNENVFHLRNESDLAVLLENMRKIHVED